MLEISRRKKNRSSFPIRNAYADEDFGDFMDEDDLGLITGGGTGGEHSNRENYCIWPEADGQWTVRCCGEIVFGPATKAAVDAYYANIMFG